MFVFDFHIIFYVTLAMQFFNLLYKLNLLNLCQVIHLTGLTTAFRIFFPKDPGCISSYSLHRVTEVLIMKHFQQLKFAYLLFYFDAEVP